ncbi:hypothetical protein [Candidatus Uabimicrobium sp. HlEnr_7]|uniref:hypothetical protein n=1 Tax=Candidatus Uabimicrobium helgolandensis TaxID=3095367 RepID=UPI003555FF1A
MNIALEVVIGLGIIISFSYLMKRLVGDEEIDLRETYVVFVWAAFMCLTILSAFLMLISFIILLIVTCLLLAIFGTKVNKKKT